MKKLLVVVLIVALCLSMCACGRSKEVRIVDKQIAEIGEVSLDSEAVLENAINGYNALSEEDKTTVKNYEILKQAQTSYLNLLISSIGNVGLEDKDALQEAQEHFNLLSNEQKEQSGYQEELEELERKYAFEELKELIRIKGSPVQTGGVNNSNDIEKWTYGNLELSKGGGVSFVVSFEIENTKDLSLGRSYYYPETWLSMSMEDDHFDFYFHSMFNAFASSYDIDLAEGKLNDVMFEKYSLDGDLPDITDFSSDVISMIRYDAPFNSDVEYGIYIRRCIHDYIRSTLSSVKNGLGFDITRLGFSEEVSNGI